MNMKYLIVFCLFTCSLISQAQDLKIGNRPLFLGNSAEPNVMFTIDNSGSMQWEVMPDNYRAGTNYLFLLPSDTYKSSLYDRRSVPNFDDDNVHNFFKRSAHNNTLFYNPNVNYQPWSNADGSLMSNANPRAALYNPGNPGAGSLNLVEQRRDYACWRKHTTSRTNSYGEPCRGYHTYWPITYFIYKSGSVTQRSSYDKVEITTSTPASSTFTSPDGKITRTRDAEIQNFANWFQYYRSRTLMARASIGRAFSEQGANFRVGYSEINQGSKTIDGVTSNSAVYRGVRPFSGTDRSEFFDLLYQRSVPTQGTPLRSAINNVGKYFERSDKKGPWGKTPGTYDSSDIATCRKSYNILMSDGYWNGSNPELGNVDNSVGSTITGSSNQQYQYQPKAPYQDNVGNTLADVAMHYWNRDLLPDVNNEVATSSINPAYWQHLVTFTVGLGVEGTLNSETDLAALTSGTKSWPAPYLGNNQKIDDLWHAAINGHGEYFSASDPDSFSESLSKILVEIAARQSSISSPAISAASLSNGATLYQAVFNSESWEGELYAFELTSSAQINFKDSWSASKNIPTAESRKIVTYSNGNGIPFRWDELSETQKSLLGSENLVNYIRGNQSNELDNNGIYRVRKSLLGDIIHSKPIFVGAPSSRWPDKWKNHANENNAPYSEFFTKYENRDALIYVGANDGMLHAFDDESGKEVFAYVPETLLNNLDELADINYSHRYFVDGEITKSDVFYDGAWHTVVVGALRGGGQGIYAIDVTDPSSFNNEENAKANVLWEFTDKDDADLGYTFGVPKVVRLQNGQWAAVFSGGYNNTKDNGSGYDSSTGNAVLYIVDIKTGDLIRKFDTQFGASDDPTGQNRPNGLATPFVADIDADNVVDMIYVGDLFGNVWKIDISSSSKANWGFSYIDAISSKPLPIFTACHDVTGTNPKSCHADNIQPITSQISVIAHPSSSGYLLLFGTGKYFETTDSTTYDQVTQTLYGVWDKAGKNLTDISRADLQQQSIIYDSSINGIDARIVSGNEVDWQTQSGWYLDLVNPNDNFNYGERIIYEVKIRSGYLVVTSIMPSGSLCDEGGSSREWALDLYTGGQTDGPVIDFDGDGSFDDDVVDIDVDGDGEPERYNISSYSRKGMSDTVMIRGGDGTGGADINIEDVADIGSGFGSSGDNPNDPNQDPNDPNQDPNDPNQDPNKQCGSALAKCFKSNSAGQRTSWQELDFIFNQ